MARPPSGASAKPRALASMRISGAASARVDGRSVRGLLPEARPILLDRVRATDDPRVLAGALASLCSETGAGVEDDADLELIGAAWRRRGGRGLCGWSSGDSRPGQPAWPARLPRRMSRIASRSPRGVRIESAQVSTMPGTARILSSITARSAAEIRDR